MTPARNIHSVFLFSAFFSVGTAALTCSILSDDLLDYYRRKQILAASEASVEELKAMIADYDILIEHMSEDPNILRRISRAMIGVENTDPNTANPRATAEQLAAARQVLMEDVEGQAAQSSTPGFLVRCGRPAFRIMLMAAGSALVLISFVWFGRSG